MNFCCFMTFSFKDSNTSVLSAVRSVYELLLGLHSARRSLLCFLCELALEEITCIFFTPTC